MQGLNQNQVIKSRAKHGSNRITPPKRVSWVKNLFANFSDPMLKIMLVALGINCVFVAIKSNDMDSNESILETLGIAIAILIAVVVSTVSEQASNSAFEKLQQTTQNIVVRAIRDNKTLEIPIEDVVVGDLIVLSSGDKVPADGVLIDGNIEVDQSVLNGESEPKRIEIRDDICSGTVVVSGQGIAKIMSVGDKTVYGKLAQELKATQPKSPLKVKLEKLAKVISIIGYIGAGLVAVAYLFSELVINGESFTMTHLLNVATLVVSVIVMAVPEGLPMMITVVLSSNVKSMMKDNVLVRKLNGIETAGSMNILFTDKTGTLTSGKLSVEKVITDKPELLNLVLRACNGATISNGRAIGGNFTDRVLLEYASLSEVCSKTTRVGVRPDGKSAVPEFSPQTTEINVVILTPFDSDKKYMSATLADGRVLTKGAPEIIASMCGTKIDVKKLTKKSYRVIACAVDNEYVGLVAIRDTVRPEAQTAIGRLSSAGVQTIMITGDAKETAVAVAREVGISGEVLTSQELSKMSDDKISKMITKIGIIARALPSDKSRLVRIAQSMGLVVGMTGDGVNDAPALKASDVGFSMGSGTEVAKEAGDVVIVDDNIQSIARATAYGRTIFKSIRKFLIFKLTINFVAMMIAIIAPFLGISTPITVLQMLWINLVMDTLAGLAYGGEKPQAKYMTEPPKRRDEPIITPYMWGQIAFGSIIIGLVSFWFLLSPLVQNSLSPHGIVYSMTAFFAFFMFINIFNSFNSRTHDINPLSYFSLNKPFMWIMGIITVAQVLLIFFGGSIFRTEPLSIKHFTLIICLAIAIIPLDIIRKVFIRWRYGNVTGT